MVRRLVLLALSAPLLFAQTSPVPGWTLAGSPVAAYNINLDHGIFHTGQSSGTLRCASAKCKGYGTLAQTIHSDVFLGRRVRFSAWVKASKAASVGLWMRVDGPGNEYLALDNMEYRRKHGTFGWKKMTIVLDVLSPGTLINYGILLLGDGQVWIDDVTVEPVDVEKVRSTNALFVPMRGSGDGEPMQSGTSPVHLHPFNLDFEM